MAQATFLVGLGSFDIVVAQPNTNQSTANQGIAGVEEIMSDACNAASSGNDTGSANMSQAGDVVEIRCLLREARNAISADSANTAIALVEEADKKLVATFGNTTNITGSVG